MRWSLAAAAALVVLSAVAPFGAAIRRLRFRTPGAPRGAVTRVEWVNPQRLRIHRCTRRGRCRGELGGRSRQPNRPRTPQVDAPLVAHRRRSSPSTARPREDRAVRPWRRSIVHKASGKRLFDMPAARPGRHRPRGARAAMAGWTGPSGPSSRTERLLGRHRAQSAGRVDRGQRAHERRRPSANLADADRVAPMLPWAKAIYLHRQRTRSRTIRSRAACRQAGRASFRCRTACSSSNSVRSDGFWC